MSGRISEDLISEICSENDIIDYVSRYTALKKTGRDYSGLCPFHSEKSPSFHVNREKQLYHCFGCGASGNLAQFVMRTENLDFVDALHVLADNAGIVIPENDGITTENHAKKQQVLEMNKVSARFFHNCLKDKSVGAEAQKYFAARRISWKTVTTYGLGYAPRGNDNLINHLKKAGYTDSDIFEAGLSVQRDGKYVDKFRDRVMFPIISVRGEVIGFGGRVMHNNKEINGYKIPKYLNSSETPVFDKGRNLFSLNLAKKANSRELILCEGYLDVISTYQAGVKNIVATLGTAITPNQAKLMLRYCDEILICYDSDEAGTKAALRAIDVIAEVGGRSRVIRLSNAKDPDEYINKNGVESFRSAVKNSMPSTEFKLSRIKGKYDTSTTDGKIKFVEEAVEILSGIKDSIEIDAYMNRIAEETGINKSAITAKFNEKSSKNHRRPIRMPVKSEFKRVRTVSADGGKPAETVRIPTALIEAQKRLLSLITDNKKYYSITKKYMQPEEFATDIHARLAKRIYECYDRGQIPTESMILNEFSENAEEMNEASAVFYNMEIYSGDDKVIYDLIYTIKANKLQMKINKENDPVKLQELFSEKDELINRRNKWEEE